MATKKVDYLRHTFLLFKRAYLCAGDDHLDITPADAMLVYLNVYNQDRLLDTPTDIVVNRLCKIWRELIIAGKRDKKKVNLVEAPSVDEEEAPAKSTSSVLNFFMGKTAYSAANPLRIELDQTHYPIRGWQAAWLNSQTMRRELKRHEAIESSTARTPW